MRVKPQKWTVLVVDDDKDDRFFVSRILKSLNAKYSIHGLGSAKEALAYLNGEGKYSNRKEFEFPSYILTDLKMRPGDGFDLLDFLKQNPAMSVIPVVTLSASDDGDDIRHAYLLGASSYIVKPQTQEELQAALRKIHEYWMICEVPEVDASGYAVETDSRGKLGERFKKPMRKGQGGK